MFNPVELSIPVFAILIGVEAWVEHRGGGNQYSFKDGSTNIIIGLASVVFGALLGIGISVIYAYCYEFAPYKFSPSSWWSWVLLFFLDDLAYYWFHRVSHECRLFWNFHVVHHSSEEFNLSVAVRQSWFSGILHWMFYAPLMLIGFAPWMLLVTHGFNLIWQFWIHTKLVKKMWLFEYILNTPSHHRVHHGVNNQYLDKNYAGVFIIWDRLFGSFVWETEEPRYGIIKPLNSFNPLWANVHGWAEMFDAIRRQKTLYGKLLCIFGSPNMEIETPSNLSADQST